MIFNLTTNNLFKVKDGGLAICCGSRFGPHFGSNRELSPAAEPFNGENNCWSFACEWYSYKIPKDSKGRNMLTQEKCRDDGGELCKFTIVELEVWEVVFEE